MNTGGRLRKDGDKAVVAEAQPKQAQYRQERLAQEPVSGALTAPKAASGQRGPLEG